MNHSLKMKMDLKLNSFQICKKSESLDEKTGFTTEFNNWIPFFFHGIHFLLGEFTSQKSISGYQSRKQSESSVKKVNPRGKKVNPWLKTK